MFVDPSATVCPNDGTSLVERFDRDPVFANYEFLGEIGAGGMGVIYKARQVILNKVVAIKTLHPHLSSPAAFRRFQNEGKATSLLQHPYIVAVHDFGVTQGGQTFMVMDFIDGETLSSLLQREGQLTEKHFLSIFIDVCDAMAHAHSRSVVHRDIKSSNIMIVKNQHGEEEIRIMDFGIAKLIADTESGANQVTRTGEVIGTATCMSPEQARGGKVDHRSDLYALGCVMYEALASCPPFAGNTPLETMLMHLEKRPMPIKQASMGHDVDLQLEVIVFRLLEKEPEKRYQSMNELKADLIALQSSSSESKKHFSKAQSKISTRQLSTKTIVGAGIAIAVLLVGLFAVLKNSSQNPEAAPKSAAVSTRPAASSTAVQPPPEEPVDDKDISVAAPSPAGTNETKDSISHQLQMSLPKVVVQYIGGKDYIADADLVAFEGQHPRTSEVVLAGATVSDAGLEHLHDLRLKRLDITGSLAKNLKWILSFKDELQELHLTAAPITHEGFKNVGKLKELDYLKVDRTNFDDSDVPSLSGLKNLRRISIHETKLSLKGLDALSNSLPNCATFEFGPPGDVKKGLYKPFTLIPSDSLSNDALITKADKEMSDKHWDVANAVLERILLDARAFRKNPNVITHDTFAVCLAKRGTCLQNLNLPYAAIHEYQHAAEYISNFQVGPWYHTDMELRIASISESLPGPENLDRAIKARKSANDFLSGTPNPDLMPQWAIFRDSNLKALQRDFAKQAKSSH